MSTITSLENFELYQLSLRLTIKVFHLCNSKVLKNEFELQNQIKRAAISIPSNMSEGWGRHSKKDFARFLSIALGSNNEVQAQLELIEMLFGELQEEACELEKEYISLGKRIFVFRKNIVQHLIN